VELEGSVVDDDDPDAATRKFCRWSMLRASDRPCVRPRDAEPNGLASRYFLFFFLDQSLLAEAWQILLSLFTG
jgi:hypothetical protein